ncbi:MAG: Gldg family protein, partial [Bdellovibrionales bacterium]|nr:Gldg family protein [Bdellovibrionales bacterium]
HSLSEQSKKILSQLNQKIFLRAFLSNPTGTPAYELLQMYALENPLVVVEAYNPDLNPDLIERFGLSSGEVLHLSFGEDEHARQVRFREIKEESITNELLKFLRRGNLKAYFVVGHGEPDLDEDVAGGISLFTEALRQEGFLTEKLLLAQNKNVPDDARLVVLFPPQTPLLTEERQMLIQYVNQGGSLLILGDPVWPVQDNGERALAREFGIEIGFNLIVDPVQGRQGAAGVRPFVTNYATHPITDGFTEESVTAFDKASTVKVTRVSDETALSLELLTTSVSAWGETDLKSLISSDRPVITRDDADITGPVAIGAVYDKLIDGSSDPQKHSRVVAFGDSDWIRNHGFRIYFNRDLALNTVNWLSGDASTVAIRPRRFRSSFAPMSEAALRGLLAASFLLPEILLIGGLGMWWRRRVC